METDFVMMVGLASPRFHLLQVRTNKQSVGWGGVIPKTSLRFGGMVSWLGTSGDNRWGNSTNLYAKIKHHL